MSAKKGNDYQDFYGGAAGGTQDSFRPSLLKQNNSNSKHVRTKTVMDPYAMKGATPMGSRLEQ